MFGIEFNPLSAVNLITTVGLTVEYLAHFVRSFMRHQGGRSERVALSFVDMGQNVIGGTLSSILGILVLGFADYEVFRVYYFNMYEEK